MPTTMLVSRNMMRIGTQCSLMGTRALLRMLEADGEADHLGVQWKLFRLGLLGYGFPFCTQL